MKFISVVLCLALSPIGMTRALAYEQATHAFITRTAIELSEQAVGAKLVKRLDLDTLLLLQERVDYFEMLSLSNTVAAIPRKAAEYERRIAKDFNVSVTTDPVSAWLLFGSVREDDNPSEDPPTPQDVSPGLRRPLNHFFDPAFNRPLTVDGLSLIDPDVHKNVDWAIGARNAFEDSNLPETPRSNSFTIFDAREAMFRALTLMTFDGADYKDIAANQDIGTRQQWRQAYWATAFRALGNVLHLNQDMAQPQHTRNEAHSGKGCLKGTTCLGGHTSVFEKYMNARAIGINSFKSGPPFGAPVPIANAPLTLANYPIPAFAGYSDYWSTAPGDASRPGLGLADYSNRGFFTAAKNFDSTEYALPTRDRTRYDVRKSVPVGWDGAPPSDTTAADVYYGEVRDDWLQTSDTNVPLTTYSLWNQFVTQRGLTPVYSLNRVNYDAMAERLLPRAVAYSAGLINFFFRGTLEIELPDEGVFAVADHAGDKGFTMLRANVKNSTPAFVDKSGGSMTQDMGDGQFFAVIRYHRDKKYAPALDTVVGVSPCTVPSAVINAANPAASTACREGVEEIVVSRPIYGKALAAGERSLLEFEFGDSPIPLGITDVVLQVVYRGSLGSEADAVAVGTVDISEPTYFAYHNATDYIHIGAHVYARGQVEADLSLLQQVQPQYCVDYRQSPARLVDGCLEPFAVDISVSFADIGNPIASVTALPARRFVRFAYLGLADEGFNPPVKSVARGLRVTVARHASRRKALIQQDGTCLPHDPLNVPPRHAQLSVIPPNTIVYRLGPFTALRGVNSWYATSCVSNGDDATPGTPDDRNSVMTSLTPDTEEVQPFALRIMAAYL